MTSIISTVEARNAYSTHCHSLLFSIDLHYPSIRPTGGLFISCSVNSKYALIQGCCFDSAGIEQQCQQCVQIVWIFQAAAPRPQGLRTVELPKDKDEHLEPLLWHLPVAQGISTTSSACVMGSIHRGRSRMAMRRQSSRRVMDPSSSLCIGPCSH